MQIHWVFMVFMKILTFCKAEFLTALGLQTHFNDAKKNPKKNGERHQTSIVYFVKIINGAAVLQYTKKELPAYIDTRLISPRKKK